MIMIITATVRANAVAPHIHVGSVVSIMQGQLGESCGVKYNNDPVYHVSSPGTRCLSRPPCEWSQQAAILSAIETRSSCHKDRVIVSGHQVHTSFHLCGLILIPCVVCPIYSAWSGWTDAMLSFVFLLCLVVRFYNLYLL
jgi:hypothetical protein